jgi:hypothetical protein
MLPILGRGKRTMSLRFVDVRIDSQAGRVEDMSFYSLRQRSRILGDTAASVKKLPLPATIRVRNQALPAALRLSSFSPARARAIVNDSSRSPTSGDNSRAHLCHPPVLIDVNFAGEPKICRYCPALQLAYTRRDSHGANT